MRPVQRHILPLLLLLSLESSAHARRYPITISDASGTWVGGPDGLLHGQGELWTRYNKGKGLTADQVNDIELSSRSVWVATPAGLSRLDKGTRRWETFATPDLPVNHVTGVSMDASDPDQLWVSTLGGGLVKFDVRKNRWTRHGKAQGLPSEQVHDVLFRGRTVFAATDAGLAALDLTNGTFKVYTASDGMAPGAVLELEISGNDLWVTSSQGLSRMSLQRRSFAAFGKAQGLPGTRLLSLARVQSLTYLVTDAGVILHDMAADTLSPFLHLKGLQGAKVRGVTSAGGFVWFATDNGLSRFDPTRKSWEHFRLEDGASSDDLSRLTVSGGNLLIYHQGGELDTYNYKKDEWMDRSALMSAPEPDPAPNTTQTPTTPGAPPATPTKPESGSSPVSLSAELDTEYDSSLDWEKKKDGWEHSRKDGIWKVNKIRLGVGKSWGRGRSLDISGKLDWGNLYPVLDPWGSGATLPDEQSDARTTALSSFQEYDLRLRYLGGRHDWLREVLLSDELRLEPEGGILTERSEVEGGRVVLELGPRSRESMRAEVVMAAGLRRGTPARRVFRNPVVGQLELMSFDLNVQFIIPSSVRVMLDGRELERNLDYFVDHSTGFLWITNTDLIHAMRVIEVDLEYEQIPRKNVGVLTVTDMVPKDGEIGQLKRSGASRWAKDEQGLFDEIDGGAEQYINRGWAQTLSQDYTWSSAGATLRIHDMETEANAKAIHQARLAGDAKPVAGYPEKNVYLEKQTASLTIKMHSKEYFIEITLDEPSMEQEVLSIARWLNNKLAADKHGTSADALRDMVFSTGMLLRLDDTTTLGADFMGSFSVKDGKLPDASRVRRNIFSMHAGHVAALTDQVSLTTRIQAAASSTERDDTGTFSGDAIRGDAMLTSPWLVLSLDGRKYASSYAGLGAARQSEFCRASDGACDRQGESQLDHEVSVRSTIQPLQWLPLELGYQRQQTTLGSDYSDAPAQRERVGVRDVATGRLSLARKGIPMASVHGGYVRRDDAMSDQDQLLVGGAVEADLAAGLLSSLNFKKIYLRGLYEYGHSTVDEYRVQQTEERDRAEAMHHAVMEARVAPTLTESGYATLVYHGLLGALDVGGAPVDRLIYWRLDGGVSSSWVPGLAARLDATLWFKDGMPFVDKHARQGTLASASLVQQRGQEADSRIAGVLDIFPGEWFSALNPLKLNLVYTYTENSGASNTPIKSVYTPGKELCDVPGDEDLDGQADCADQDCAFADACLVVKSEKQTHRVFGTLSWDTPGKLQVELFGDLREAYSGADKAHRQSRQEVRSFVTWRPVYPSPITLRFDMVRDWIRPDKYDSLTPALNFTTLTYTPALEWRRRWSQAWWHLAKLTFSYNSVRDLFHIRTIEDIKGKKGDKERVSYNSQTLTPSLEVRRRFEDPNGRWSVRPYARVTGTFTWGQGVESRVDQRVCGPDDPCLVDASQEGQGGALTLGLIWVHSDKLFIDFDLTGSYTHCSRPTELTAQYCGDKVKLTPKLLATVRY